MADEQRETLRRLEERLVEASETAERLIDEVARTGRRRKPPPAGWQAPGNGHQASARGPELDALLGAVRSLRDLVPPEVQQRLAEAFKEVLMAIRALIDWYIERLEHRRAEPPSVQDIPID